MQVLTDAQWAKFEAAIAAAGIRGTRPRTEDRLTIEAIIWRLDNERSGVPSQPNWVIGTMLTCGSGGGPCVACRRRSWPIWSLRADRNWAWSVSTARSRGLIRRHPAQFPARPRAKTGLESATHLRRGQQKRSAGPVARWSWHQDRRRLRCGGTVDRLPADTRPSVRTGTVPDAAAPDAASALLGAGGHGLRRAGLPLGRTCVAWAPFPLCPLDAGQAPRAVPRLHLPAPQPDRALLVAVEGAPGCGDPIRQDSSVLCRRLGDRSLAGLDQKPAPVSSEMRTGPSRWKRRTWWHWWTSTCGHCCPDSRGRDHPASSATSSCPVPRRFGCLPILINIVAFRARYALLPSPPASFQIGAANALASVSVGSQYSTVSDSSACLVRMSRIARLFRVADRQPASLWARTSVAILAFHCLKTAITIRLLMPWSDGVVFVRISLSLLGTSTCQYLGCPSSHLDIS